MHQPATTPSTDISAIQALVAPDMREVNRLIGERLHSDVALINQLGQYIINSGGKRLRPTLLLLSAHAFGARGGHVVTLAAIIEFIHTATLLHDDVVDESKLRRGQETANSVWGNEASVLVGDFLYSRAFQMMVDVNRLDIMGVFADATNTIARGEVQQLLNCHDPDTTEERYIEVIRNKTAKLFEAAAQIGAMTAGQDQQTVRAMAGYGMHLGAAFQLIDDVLDYSASPEEMGKNVGDDLAEGKPTLPLIHALRHGNAEQAGLIRRAIRDGGLADIDRISEAIEATGAITYTAELAKSEAGLALAAIAGIPRSVYRDALEALAEFAVARTY